MIDLHSHILPNIDDGAADESETLALLRLAAADGIRQMVATPHINPGYFDNNKLTINTALASARALIHQHQIPLQLAAAAEVRLTEQLIPAIEQQQMPFLGLWQSQRVLLLELPHSHVPAGTDKLLKWLGRQQIIAMIAHPERNRDIQTNPALLQSLKNAGCLFQLTASSLLGDLGDRHQQCAEFLVRQRIYQVMATDCHNLQRRPPKLRLARQTLAQLTDDDYAEALVCGHPAQITATLDFGGEL
ncbi:CpsB/CapC family capsule biosynthesis tyrosine phosphatase [Rheinheimera texasensis]|uniref:tyrosine-protein phosphatase n=1 Tax=Rheinheimera texasensis TaxID=306205 RepID=UPI0032B1BCCE